MAFNFEKATENTIEGAAAIAVGPYAVDQGLKHFAPESMQLSNIPGAEGVVELAPPVALAAGTVVLSAVILRKLYEDIKNPGKKKKHG